jgi:hypothetical protein
MVALTQQKPSRRSDLAWQDLFLQMLPTIHQHAQICFRRLTPELREECIQEAICNACCAVARLAELGKLDLAYAGPLAHFAVSQVKAGRKVGGRLNCQDVLSRYCQRKKDFRVERLDRFDEREDAWLEAVIQDTRTAPVPDIVCFRMDFREWLAMMPCWKSCFAQSLAMGNRTKEVAKRFHVTAGRVAQLRKEFFESWERFQGRGKAGPA